MESDISQCCVGLGYRFSVRSSAGSGRRGSTNTYPCMRRSVQPGRLHAPQPRELRNIKYLHYRIRAGVMGLYSGVRAEPRAGRTNFCAIAPMGRRIEARGAWGSDSADRCGQAGPRHPTAPPRLPVAEMDNGRSGPDCRVRSDKPQRLGVAAPSTGSAGINRSGWE
jgi:hypothetical protein